MDQQMKKEALKSAAPAVVPVCRALINNHFENKRIEQRQKFEVAKAKHASQSIQAVGDGESASATATETATFEAEMEGEPSDDPLGDAIELAEDLDRALGEASQREECAFCQDVLEGLRDEPPEVQQQGLRELRELRRVMYSDPSREEVDRVMDQCEVIPRLIVDG